MTLRRPRSPFNMASKYPQVSPLLCDTCVDITSTMSGLKALASRDGFRHLSLQELIESANNGCPFCKFLRRTHNSDSHPEAYLRIFTRCPIPQSYEAEAFKIQSESKGHPFNVASLKSLWGALWNDSIDSEKLATLDYNYTSKLTSLGSFSLFLCFTSAGMFQC